MTSGKRIKWTPEMDALLGTMSDSAIAQRFGLSDKKIVRSHREKIGAPAYAPKIGLAFIAEKLNLPEPSGAQVKAARLAAVITLREAAAMVSSPSARAWLHYESETRQMGADR